MTAIPADRSSSYRPEIQGLRAVAALLVAIYHIWLGRVSGGVDVFFAVSAFLITYSLLRQAETTGRIDFAAFWGGLTRRLLPAATLVLLAISATTILWLPRTMWQNTLQQIVASLLYLENWQLAFNAVDYLAQGQSASPVQHFWALSIQGQFYFLWPFLFVAALWVTRKLELPLRPVLLVFVAAVFVMSFAYSVLATRSNQTFTYFNTLARLWEFCLGACVALIPALPIPRWLRVLGGWLGLAGIVVCGMVLQVSQVFPGYAALWPVGCALLILVAGTSGSAIGADRLLSSTPLVFMGNASYGLYLWHWPVLILYRWFTDHRPVGLAGGVGVLAVSVLLALLTTMWVDSPRRRDRLAAATRRQRTALVAGGALPVLLVSLGWGAYMVQQKQLDGRPMPVGHPDYPGARAWHPTKPASVAPGVPVYPGMLAVSEDLPIIYRDGCYKPDPVWQSKNCVYGDRNAPRTIALVGGSHSVHWLPALDLLAKEHGWRVSVYTKSNCLFSVEIDQIRQDKWCRQWNEGTLKLLLEDPPEIVLTTSTRGSGRDEYVPRGFLLRWEQLNSAGIKVAAIRDTPWMQFWVPECLEMKNLDFMACSQQTEKMLRTPSPVEQVRSEARHVHFIDLSEYFCNSSHCPPVIGNIVVYRDDSHITPAYSRSLAPLLWDRLSGVLLAEPPI